MLSQPDFGKKIAAIRMELMVCLFLLIATLAVYWQVRHFDFINCDDPVYLTENPNIQSGFSLKNIYWAFTAIYAANWHPLTWLSHMLDIQLYGLSPGSHHFTNLQFHLLNTLLIFLVFRGMTGTLWRSAVVALLFALHPLHVESVAWISERKDVLSTFFWMLTLLGYNGYVRQPTITKYLLIFLCLSLGLMAKPMLVTVPLVLLLLDYWPLNRFHLASLNNRTDTIQKQKVLYLVWEKVPFFILSIASSVVTIYAQHQGGAVSSIETVPIHFRIANAMISYVDYIRKMVWPNDLAVVYPYPENLRIWQIAVACVVLTGITLLVFKFRRHHPYLVFGWLWYIVTLIPVIGLVQVGLQAMADRYTYMPLIGLFVMVVWGASALPIKWHDRKVYVTLAGIILLSALMTASWIQASYWKDSATLFKRALMVTDRNFFVHNNLGVVLESQGKTEEAIRHYTETLRIDPNFAKAHFNLGQISLKQGKIDEAISHYLSAAQIDPKNVAALNNLGQALESQGKIEEAARYYIEASRIDPNYAQAHNNLGNVLARQGRIREAMEHYLKAQQIDPNYKEAHYNLGTLLFSQGRIHEAIDQYQGALRIDPLYVLAHNNLAVALAKEGRITDAIVHFQEALRIDPDYIDARNNLEKMVAAREKTNETISTLQQRIAQDPLDAAAHYDLGQIYKGMGELTRAADYYQQAISIAPAFFDASKNLAVVYAMQGKYDTAREYLHRCIALQPDQWEGYYFISGTYARQNKTQESIRWLKQAIEKGFDNWDILKADQNFESIRATSYYKELLKNR